MIEPLIKSLNDPELPVRVAALHALSASTDDRRIPPLLRMLKTNCPRCARGGGSDWKTGDAKFLSDILPLLKDSKFEVRVTAIAALGNIKKF